MRRYWKMLLTAFLTIGIGISPITAWAEEWEMEDPSESNDVFIEEYAPADSGEMREGWGIYKENEEDGETIQYLKVGTATHPSGMFFTDMWGRNTSDLDIQAILHGFNLVRWNGEEGLFGVDPSVVSGITVMENDAGDRGFMLTLYDDLYYSDGTPVTAWDYAFSWLLLSSPEIGDLGVTPLDLSWMAGYQDFRDGVVPYLQGIHVTADDALTVIIDHNALPFFYEMGLLNCNPYPIHVLAPGVRVFDDGNGVYLANDPDWEEESEAEDAEDQEPENPDEPRFTAELLARTILDPETGYLSHPSVVSGPYMLTSWDGETTEFAKNIYYKGNAAGKKPIIDFLTYLCLENEDMVDQLEEEQIGLLNKMTNTDTIVDGMALVGEKPYSMSNYARTGLSYITFARNRKEVASKAVRQAIAWSMDRDELMNRYTGNFGLRVDGYYGIGQWMYGLANGNTQPPVEAPEDENDAKAMAEYEAELAAWEEVNLDNLTEYTLDLEQAAALLDADGWQINTQGLREKNGIVLDLTLAYPEGNKIQEAWEELLIPNLEEIGIRLTLLPMGMEELLDAYYHQVGQGVDAPQENVLEAVPDLAERLLETADAQDDDLALQDTVEIPVQPDMFYLGSNFSTLFLPEYFFDQYAPVENTEQGLAPDTENRADVIREELEAELTEARVNQPDHTADYVEAYEEALENAGQDPEDALAELMEAEDLDEAENPEEDDEAEGPVLAEQTIRDLTEAAMEEILSVTAEDPDSEEDAELSLADVSQTETGQEPLTPEEVEQAYTDIYQDYTNLYRDYGSLYALAMDMRRTDPGEVLQYMQRWVRFQEQFNDVLPMIPIYSNVYFDFYTEELANYYIAENITWGNAILGAFLQEEALEPETEPEEELEDDEDWIEFDD